MAAPLKEMLRVGLGLTVEHTDGALKQEPCDELCGKTPVEAMQTIGTEWGRKIIGQDLWLNRWFELCKDKPRVVVDDVRFHNELAAIREKNGVIIRVRRTDVEGKDSHESEIYALQFKPDFEIWNNGSITDFHAKLPDFLKDAGVTF